MVPRLPARCWRQLSSPVTNVPTLRPSAALVLARPAPTSLLTNQAVRALTTTTALSKREGWSTLARRYKPTRFNQVTAGLPAPTTGPAAALKRKHFPLRTGVLAVKKGMTVFMGRTGARIPCTVLQMDRVQVVFNKTRDKHGYWAVQVGLGEKNPANVTRPLLGYYEAKGIPPKEYLAEFRVKDESGLLPIGVQLMPDWFYVGQRVDCRSYSKGQGFAGGMKRHGFSGQEASHGNSLNHRTLGSVGASQGAGSRVLPGKKMPGRMGNQRVTVQNLPILMVDNDLGIIVVKGCVAGKKGSIVRISDAIKKPPPPKEWIEKTRKQLEERFPHAEEALEAARKRHLELKAARQERRIAELLQEGMSSPNEAHALIIDRIEAEDAARDQEWQAYSEQVAAIAEQEVAKARVKAQPEGQRQLA